MTNTIERLKELLAKATPGPWEYRPDGEMDDWGFIRGPADGRGWKCVVAMSRAGHLSRFYDAGYHRARATDPFEPNGRLIVEAINALPHLIATLETLTPSAGEVERANMPSNAEVSGAVSRLGEIVGTTCKRMGFIGADLDQLRADIRTMLAAEENYVSTLEELAAADQKMLHEFQARAEGAEKLLKALASPPLPHPDIEGRARQEAIKARALDIANASGAESVHEQLSALIEASAEFERRAIADWMRHQNATSECGPFALGNASHAIEAGTYRSLASKEEGRL